MIRVSASSPYQEYRIGSTTTASAAQLLAYNVKNQKQRLLLEAVTDRVTFKFGDSSVVASKTVTSNALPAKNFSVPAGAIFEIDLETGNGLDYVSIINETSTATGIIRLCEANT